MNFWLGLHQWYCVNRWKWMACFDDFVLFCRPFKCEYCERRFITKQSLSRHIMNKHAEETGLPVPVHVCELCGKEFKSKKNLKEHRSPWVTFEFDGPSQKTSFVKDGFDYEKMQGEFQGAMSTPSTRDLKRAPTRWVWLPFYPFFMAILWVGSGLG